MEFASLGWGERLTTFFGLLGTPSGAVNSIMQDAANACVACQPANAAVQSRGMTAIAISNTRSILIGSVDSFSMCCLGRPDILTGSNGTRMSSDVASIINRYRSVGARILDDLHGAFAIAIYDNSKGCGLIAIDRMGIQPLFYCEHSQAVAFGIDPADVIASNGIANRVSDQAIFDYLYCHVVPAPRAILENVSRLMPGECIEITPDRIVKSRYWRPVFDESSSPAFDTMKPKFVEALRCGVADAMRDARCGAFLSGGTDSSTIAGLMCEVSGQSVKTFSIGFAASGFDEMEYARLSSRHFGTQHHEYYVTPRDIVATLPKLAIAHPQPFGNSSALPTYFCARLANENGIEKLLGGDGGDELFGGNSRYAKQYIFSLYDRLPNAMRALFLKPLSQSPSVIRNAPLLNKIVSYVEQASLGMPGRLETYNLLARLGYDQVLGSRLANNIATDEPSWLNSSTYWETNARAQINRMLALDFKTTLADSDLPKVVQSCELAGLRVAFPMLDTRVVDFSLALPPGWKLRRTTLRYFFKRALKDFLPLATIRKSKQGFGLPFGEWVMKDAQLRSLAFDTLNVLKRRNLIQPAFIENLKNVLLPQHPNYYGTMVWLLIVLELWMQNFDSMAGRRLGNFASNV